MSVFAPLLAAVRAALDEVPGPGGAECRARLAHGPERPVAPRELPVVARWLDAALAAAGPRHGLAPALAGAAGALGWVTYDAYPPDRIGPAFASGHAFAPLVGGEGAPFPAEDFEIGVFLMAPGLHYPDHRHAAPELYLPITGPHRWRFDGAGELAALPAWTPVWNPPQRIHATEVGEVPFLALFVWTRDVALPAGIWPP